MPNIKVIYWNIENFGSPSPRRGNYVPLCNFIAQVVKNVDADILCLMELKPGGMGFLNLLRQSLINAYTLLGVPRSCDWYYDCIRGSFVNAVAPGPAFNTSADIGFRAAGHSEGYAVFWKLNIAKFNMQRADPLNSADLNDPSGTLPGGPPLGPPGPQPNLQSFGVSGTGMLIGGGDILVLPGATFTLPTNTVVGVGGIPAGLVVGGLGIPAGPMAASRDIMPGATIPTGTSLGPGGLILNLGPLIPNPIVIPGGYNFNAAFTLPLSAIPPLIVPRHILSLVMSGKYWAPGAFPPPYPFPGALGAPSGWWRFCRFPTRWVPQNRFDNRRPAFCTIKTIGVAGGAANDLIPITVYHAPNTLGGIPRMSSGAMSRSLYQAYDHNGAAPGYVNNNYAVFGGDFNVRLDPNNIEYQTYTSPLAVGGADCNHVSPAGVLTPHIRAFQPAPMVLPTFPPPPPIPTQAENPENKSTIQLLDLAPPHLPVLSANTDHYRRLAIDNVFYRGFVLYPPGVAPVNQAPRHPFGDIYDLLRAITGTLAPGGAAGFHIPLAIIQTFLNLPVFTPPGAAAPVAPPAAGIAAVLNATTLFQDIQAGGFGNALTGLGLVPTFVPPPWLPIPPPATVPLPPPITVPPARRAAEFLRKFISDHLPVIFEMNL